MEQNFIENELIILTKQTLDILLQEENCSDLISLYTFYYYTSKWQKTNQPYCTDSYCQKGLHWGYDKFIKAKKKLFELKLIEQVINRINGKFEGYYIKLNFIFKKETVKDIINKPVPLKHSTDKQSTNALSDINLNALSTNILSKDNKEINLFDFLQLNFSPIKDKLIKYFDLYKEIHPLANKEKFFKKEKIDYINRLCGYILNGFPKNKFNNIKTFIKENNILYDPDIGLSGDLNKLNDLLDNALLSLNVNYTPSDKVNITSNFAEFLMNDFTGFSYFFQYGFNPPKLLKDEIKEKKVKDKYPEYTNIFMNVLNINKNNDLVMFVNQLVKKNQEIKNYTFEYNKVKYKRDQLEPLNNNDQDYNNYIRNTDGFVNQFKIWLEEKLDQESFKFQYQFFKSYMKEFEKWMFDRFDRLTFFPSDESMIYKIENYIGEE